MDCCNYMSYKNHYYGTQQYFEQMPQYHAEYYNNPPYSEYYGNNTPYYSSYPWQHCNTASFPDYTYNPKEARIRKAMRDANRERAMGVAPATRGGRRSQPWVHPETDDHFMMTPSHGMRGVVGSPMCGTGFPIGNVGNGQFIQPMHSYNKHMHLISHDNNGYLQPNPMAQLQHQTDMWNQYQHSPNPMRPTPTEYVMPNSQMPNYHHQQATEMHQTNEASSSIERVKIGPETFTELNSTATSPHTNENVPPNHNNFEGKIEPLMESSNVSQAPFMNLYQENVSAHSHFDKNEKVKKISLPATESTASTKESTANADEGTSYYREYIRKYVDTLKCDVLDIVFENSDTRSGFSYVTYPNGQSYNFCNSSIEDLYFIQSCSYGTFGFGNALNLSKN